MEGLGSGEYLVDGLARAHRRALVLKYVHCRFLAPEGSWALRSLQVTGDDLNGQRLGCARLAHDEDGNLVEDAYDCHE